MTELLQPPATLLMGDSGSGKTSSLATYAKAGIETFVLFTEPGGPEALLNHAKRIGAPIDKLHWAYTMPADEGWSALTSMTEVIGTQSYEMISQNKSGIGKDTTRKAAMNILNNIQNFKCERTGKEYGDVTTWGPERCFAMDGLSGISDIGWALTVGYKPTAAQGEWNIAMNWVNGLLRKITSDRKCHFVLIAHIEKEMNEITGVNNIMVSTLGRKLAPKIPKNFSEVIIARRPAKAGDKFLWSNIEANMTLKNRSLPMSDKIEPDFGQLVKLYEERLKAVEGSVQPPTEVKAP